MESSSTRSQRRSQSNRDAAGKNAIKEAPKATGETAARFTVRDPNPDRGLVTWKDRANNEDGYRIYAKRVYCGLVAGADPNQALDTDDFTRLQSDFVRVGKVDANATDSAPDCRNPVVGTGAPEESRWSG